LTGVESWKVESGKWKVESGKWPKKKIDKREKRKKRLLTSNFE
jgi:hypothetical protein